MKRITVIGSMNMDLTICTPKVPQLGETVLGGGFLTAPGGKGANQAIAAAKLGYPVSFVGSVGADAFGQRLVASLSESGVDVTHVSTDPQKPTGVAVIVVSGGDNFIIIDQGANNAVTPEAVNSLEALIRESSIVILQLEIPLETVRTAVKIAKAYQVPVLLNPAPAVPLEDELLKQVDILTPNETECGILTGRTVNDAASAAAAGEALLARGVKQVVITIGSQGVLYSDGGTFHRIPAYSVQAVDSTAAGDSFTGALAGGLTEGKSLAEAARFATAVAACTVTKRGAQDSLPTMDEVRAFLAAR